MVYTDAAHVGHTYRSSKKGNRTTSVVFKDLVYIISFAYPNS